jgi:hypothetical protein
MNTHRAVRFSLVTAVLAIFVVGIALGFPLNSFTITGTAHPGNSWLTRLHLARRAKPLPPTQTANSPTRNTQAVSLAQQTVRALVGSTAIIDATVQGTANYVAGSDQEKGTATLLAHSGYEANVALALSGGQRSEVWNGSNAPPQGKWSGTDTTWHTTPLHRCWTDPTWFFPALTLQSALNDSQISFSYVGQENKAGVAVQHIQIARLVPGQTATATSLIQRLSQMDFYLDSSTSLPVAIDFNAHPDNDAGVNQPVEIQFSGWHAVNGIQVPSGIQKFLQGSLSLDLSELTVSANTGIPQGDFAI